MNEAKEEVSEQMRMIQSMQQHQVHDFLARYFEANDSPIARKPLWLFTIQLSIELDKLLMNRPFYWHYLEKTGGEYHSQCKLLL